MHVASTAPYFLLRTSSAAYASLSVAPGITVDDSTDAATSRVFAEAYSADALAVKASALYVAPAPADHDLSATVKPPFASTVRASETTYFTLAVIGLAPRMSLSPTVTVRASTVAATCAARIFEPYQ